MKWNSKSIYYRSQGKMQVSFAVNSVLFQSSIYNIKYSIPMVCQVIRFDPRALLKIVFTSKRIYYNIQARKPLLKSERKQA